MAPPLARRYLGALALAPRPQPAVVEAVLRAADEAADPGVAEAALLAAAAAAARLPPAHGAAVRDALARSLANCKVRSTPALAPAAHGATLFNKTIHNKTIHYAHFNGFREKGGRVSVAGRKFYSNIRQNISRYETYSRTTHGSIYTSLYRPFSQDDECRRVRLHALGNLRRDDTIESLLEHAERDGGAAALAALDALDGVVGALARPERLERLERLALAPRPLELRAAALDLLLRCSAPAPFALPRTLLALHAAAPPELRRLAWQRLRALAVDHEHVRKLIRLLPRRLRGWDAQALPGRSRIPESMRTTDALGDRLL